MHTLDQDIAWHREQICRLKDLLGRTDDMRNSTEHNAPVLAQLKALERSLSEIERIRAETM